MRLSSTSKKLLKVFFDSPTRSFYINELIRHTGFYPNAVYQSLKSLEKQKIIGTSRKGRFRFYRLNQNYEFLEEVKSILGKQDKGTLTSGFDWVKILNRQASYSFHIALCEANMKNLKDTYGVSVPTYWYNFVTFGVYYSKDELRTLGEVMSKKIKTSKDFARKDIVLCQNICDELVKLAEKIPLLNLIKLPDEELARWLKKFYLKYLAVFPFVTVPHGIERFFEGKIREEVKDENVLKILLSPVSMEDEERNSALKVAVLAKEKGLKDKKVSKQLTSHCEKFCWLPLWSLHAQSLSREYFETEIKNILEKVTNPKKELKRIKQEEKKSRKKLDDGLKKIKASRILRELVELLQEYIHLRVYRKNAISKAHYYHLPLVFEAGRRLGLNDEEVKLLSHKEMIDGLLGKLTKKKLKQLTIERKEGWGVLMLKGRIKTVFGVKEIIETMERYKIIAPTSAMQRSVKGNVACGGKVTGRVKVVKRISELDKVEKGDVLVTRMTTPDYMIAIHKAAAIVTDEGGITCHAAIVSREFNIPCIVATKNATQILTDNNLVEVDAMEGVVRVVEALEIPEDVRVVAGNTIYRGKVRGKAIVVLDAADFSKVRSGDILIAPQTTPEYLSLLYRVGGFIVDEDSLTSHGVLYGKSLKIPSIMGTKIARQAFKNGDKIELDATNGIVKRLV